MVERRVDILAYAARQVGQRHIEHDEGVLLRDELAKVGGLLVVLLQTGVADELRDRLELRGLFGSE